MEGATEGTVPSDRGLSPLRSVVRIFRIKYKNAW